jgi:hypothetical protein
LLWVQRTNWVFRAYFKGAWWREHFLNIFWQQRALTRSTV